MLLLTNPDIAQVLDIRDCLAWVEQVEHEIAEGNAVNMPRTDVYTPSNGGHAPFHRFSVSAGSSRARGYVAVRMMSDMVSWPVVDGKRRENKFAIRPGTYCGFLILYSADDGAPLAIMHDGLIQHYRVGAGAGVATRLLSREESGTVGMIGSGGMARSYLDAFVNVRTIRRVRVYSPNRDHRDQYAAEMQARHRMEIVAVDSARSAVAGADIVALCVSSVEPVFFAEWLEPGMHITDVTRPSTPSDFVRSVDLAFWHGNAALVVENLPATASYARGGYLSWIAGNADETAVIPRVPPNPETFSLPTLADLVAQRVPGRTSPSQTTFFHNIGTSGQSFTAIAGGLYERAVERGVGTVIPTEWFLEDIRD